MNEKVENLLNKLKEAIFVDKHNCIACGAELRQHNRLGLCEDCLAQIRLNDKEICNKCGRVLANEAQYCDTCQNFERHFDQARSVCVYEGIAKKIVHKLKFSGAKYIGKYISNGMVDKYLDCGFECDCVVPVPLSKKRLRKRGFNQANAIAKPLAKQLKLDFLPHAVVKIRDTAEQARKTGKEREANVLGVYEVVDKSAIEGKKILIVDDVLTTGATSSEVAKILYKAKAKSVCVLTFCSTKYIIQTETGEVKYDED